MPDLNRSYDVSVIVPTFNREGALRDLLARLAAQRTDACYEVIVVDNASTDGTAGVVESFVGRVPGLRYVLESRRGVSFVRNTGASHAGAAILAFIDDDLEPAVNWLDVITRTLAAHTDVDCISGRVDARYPHRPPAWLDRNHYGAIALRDRGGVRIMDADHALRCLGSGNFAIRRPAFEAVGGFSPDFPRCEDREFELRLWAAGKRGMYVPELIVTAEIPADRLTKAYHRRWHLTTGKYHALMGYPDRLDDNGRLPAEPPRRLTLFGVPGIVYRTLFRHLRGWAAATLMRRASDAFYHETRILQWASYIKTRATCPTSELRDVWQHLKRRRTNAVRLES